MNDEDLEEKLIELKEELENLREEIGIENRRELIEDKKEFVEEEIQKPRHQIDYDKVISEVAGVKNLEYFDTNETVAKKIIGVNNIIDMLLDTEGEKISCNKSLCSEPKFGDDFCLFHTAKEKHGDRILEEYPEPFNYIAVMAMQQDCRKHLKGKSRLNTSGAEQCYEQGITDQTKKWLDQISEDLQEHDHMKKQWIPMGKIASLEDEIREDKQLMVRDGGFDETEEERYDAKMELIGNIKQIHKIERKREESPTLEDHPKFIDIDYVKQHLNGLRSGRNDYMMKEENPEFHMKRAREWHHAALEIMDLVEDATGIDPERLLDDSIKSKQEVMEERLEMLEEKEREKMEEVIEDMLDMDEEVENENE